MGNALLSIKKACFAIRAATLQRDAAIMDAFDTFQNHHPVLAQMLIENLRDHRKAAHWMCLHQRAFDGKNAYEVLIEGHDDLVWDEVARSSGEDIPAATNRRINRSSMKG